MSDPFDFLGGDASGDMPFQPDFGGDFVQEAPRELDVLPDGRDAIVIGDVTGSADFNHKQGDNPFGMMGDCGLVSVENVLDQFGVDVSETDVVSFAASTGQCDVSGDKAPSDCGGTTEDQQANILTQFGIPAHVEYQTPEALAASIEDGHGVIAEVNAGIVWNDANYVENGQANHAVNVSGVARDPVSGEIQGFFINDSGTGASGQFVPVETFEAAWSPDGAGVAVVTDAARTFDA